MPINNEIVFTAIPSTTDAGPTLSVLVTHRLVPGATGTLADHDGFVWPTLVADFELEVIVDGVGPLAASWDRTPLSPPMWEALFPATTRVVAWDVAAEAKAHADRPIQTYAVKEALARVNDLYIALAAAGGQAFPGRGLDPVRSLNAVREDDGLAGRIAEGRFRLRDKLGERARTTLGTLTAENVDDTAERGWTQTLVDVTDFYGAPYDAELTLRDRQYPQDPRQVPPLPFPAMPTPHFHELVSMVTHHPSLMRPLGLVIDLQVPALATLKDHGKMQVKPVRDSAKVTFTSPWTEFVAGEGFLFPGGTSRDHQRGMLRVGDRELYSIYQTDLDGSLLKLANRPHEPGFAPAAPETPESVPALRTGAITIARHGRAEDVADAIDRSAELAGSAAPPLVADDLYQGYRVDARRMKGSWRSLCARSERGQIGKGDKAVAWPEGHPEGIVSVPGATSPTDVERAKAPLRIHEALFSWDGWSLVAPRPGAIIDDIPRELNDPGPLDYTVDIDATPRTLLRLRYGERYQLRARMVDLAGNSLSLKGADEVAERAGAPKDGLHASEPITYLRHEPVASPMLGPLTHFTEGESLERLVIRSGGGKDRPSVADYASAAPKRYLYGAANDRHLGPPKVSQAMAEAHAMLDALDPVTSFWVSARELGAPGDMFVIGPFDGSYRKLKRGSVLILGPGRSEKYPRELADKIVGLGPHTLDPATFPDLLVDKKGSDRLPWRGAPLEAGEQLAWPETLEVSWLTDPMARGVRLWRAEERHDLDFPVDGNLPTERRWPLQTPLRLRLVEHAKELTVSTNGAVLEVALPPGTMETFRLLSTLETSRLPHHAWWHAAAAGTDGRADIEAGKHWMVTPWREVTFVHAVQKPLELPDAADRSAWQRLKAGDTFAVLAGGLELHAPSTGHVDLVATWSDRIDNLADPDAHPATDESHHGGHVAQVAVDYVWGASFPIPGVDGWLPDGTVMHQLGDTRRHDIDYQLEATTRYREYFAPEITADPENLKVKGAPMRVIIKSSARPEPPRVLYVMPTFRWEPSADPLRKHRTGRGLRVWLDRPWWSSGNGERLGVVVVEEPWNPPAGTEVPKHVTWWGGDPRFPEHQPGGLPTVDDFPNATEVSDPIFVPGGGRARVAGFEVHFDEDRRLWYADLDVDTGNARTPFVSLSLCRWQPESLPNVEVSTLVRQDFVQVLPDRGASVVWLAHGAAVTVTMEHPRIARAWHDAKRDSVDHIRREVMLVEQPAAKGPFGLGAAFAPMIDAGLIRPQADKWERFDDGAFITEAELQRRGRTARIDALWERVPGVAAVSLPGRKHKDTHEFQWHGRLEWAALGGDYEYRVLIRQHEVFAADPAVEDKQVSPGVLPHDRRLMFAAEFALPSK